MSGIVKAKPHVMALQSMLEADLQRRFGITLDDLDAMTPEDMQEVIDRRRRELDGPEPILGPSNRAERRAQKFKRKSNHD